MLKTYIQSIIILTSYWYRIIRLNIAVIVIVVIREIRNIPLSFFFVFQNNERKKYLLENNNRFHSLSVLAVVHSIIIYYSSQLYILPRTILNVFPLSYIDQSVTKDLRRSLYNYHFRITYSIFLVCTSQSPVTKSVRDRKW